MNNDLIKELRDIANDLDEIRLPRFASIVDEIALTVLAQEGPADGNGGNGEQSVAPPPPDPAAQQDDTGEQQNIQQNPVVKPLASATLRVKALPEQLAMARRQQIAAQQAASRGVNKMKNQIAPTQGM